MGIHSDCGLDDRKSLEQGSDTFLVRSSGRAGDVVVPEETIFGILSRRHVLSGYSSSGTSLLELTGRRTISPSTSFPAGLKTMLSHLALPVADVDTLVRQHTILPYFRLFTSPMQYNSALHAIAEGTPSAIKLTLGWVASRISAADRLSYCPQCIVQDKQELGVATWYRVHQLPGVLVCPYHGVPLMESDCLAKRLGRLQFFLPDHADTRFHVSTIIDSREQHAKLLLIARLSAEALVVNEHFPGNRTLQAHYTHHLLRDGFATSTARIRQHELREELLRFWAPLQTMPIFQDLLANRHRDQCWLAALGRKPRGTQHPLKHLLLIGFLKKSLTSFFESDAVVSATAPSIPHTTVLANGQLEQQLHELIVIQGRSVRQAAQALRISVNTALVHAQRANLPVRLRPKMMQFKLYGRIRAALEKGTDVREIALKLNVSASTVNRVLGGDTSLQQARAMSIHMARLHRARHALCTVLHQAPTLGFKALREALPAEVTWLYRHDRCWLQQNLHPASRHTATRSHVDWTSRDRALAREVRRAAAEILAFPGKPLRVTRNELGRRTSHPSWLDKHIAKLPRTQRELSNLVESTDAFQRRRFFWWRQQLAATAPLGQVPTWQIYRAAGIRTHIVLHEHIS
ncbi:MAG TPA: TnsD family Tn7-like transposition protein [Noviherbaspirillum sp.]|nr:TnsD family Tn7-like transposition protein [Noviherbaspirillum sp.]